MVDAICDEIDLQKNYLPDNILKSIYLGGGTPSLLNQQELEQIFGTIHQKFKIKNDAIEITLEANPDDLTADKVKVFKKLGINRLSIGVQSFQDQNLKITNRAHNGQEALKSIQIAQDSGLTNLTIDLIYAIPNSSHQILEEDLEIFYQLQIPHLSAYSMTIEPKTVFGNWVQKGKMQSPSEQFAVEQFDILMRFTHKTQLEQYEISNFAYQGKYAVHNTNYWFRKPYLGVGPSAHSFNGVARQYNIANNQKYIKSIQQNQIPAEIDALTPADIINEYLMTRLRTKWGLDLKELRNTYNFKLLQEKETLLEQFFDKNWLSLKDDFIYLTQTGKLWADEIAQTLFI